MTNLQIDNMTALLKMGYAKQGTFRDIQGDLDINRKTNYQVTLLGDHIHGAKGQM